MAEPARGGRHDAGGSATGADPADPSSDAARAAEEAIPEDLRRLRASIRGRFGLQLELYDRLDSTNRRLFQRGLEGAPEGTVVIADAQEAGRGRLSRSWFSPPGVNLYLSVLLRPVFEPSRAALITLLTAVAARETFGSFGLEAGIKWPNDLLAGTPSRKLSGILAEMQGNASGIDFIVLGIGLNLNVAEMPVGLAEIATSFRIETGRCVDRAALAAQFLSRLEAWYDRYSAGEADAVIDAWRAGSLTLGRTVRFERDGAWQEGLASDIDRDGALIVEAGGDRVRVTAGDIYLG